MTRINILRTFAWLAVLSVMITGEVFAQATAPSLVTQQLRLSDGTGKYINLRAGINGTASDGIPYFLDQAPAVDATKGYSLWLKGNNHIVTSDPFVAGATTNQFWLERVKAGGTGLEWIDPASLIKANNGLTVDAITTPGSPTVQLGGPLIKATTVDEAAFSLSFINGSAITPTLHTLGNGTNVFNISMDPSATGNITMNNIQTLATASTFLVLDATNKVKSRPLSSLVVADNGISINAVGGYVELGGAVTNTNPLLVNRFVTLGGKNLTFDGAGNFNIGDGTSVQNITLDPSATGSTNFKNLANDATPLATDRFVIMGAASDKAFTRALTSLVNANNGLIIDNAVTPGTSTVQLGAPLTGGALLLTDRFIGMSNKALNFEGDGTYNIGTTGNIAFNVKTGTSSMTLQGATLAAPAAATVALSNFHNIMYVDEVTNVVHTVTSANMARNDVVTDFVGIDAATGKFVKSISPTAGIYRGHTAWNGTAYTQTITLPVSQTIANNASVTATNENHTGQGTVAIQVTNVTLGAGGTFTVEASDILPVSSFINWVVINP